MRDKTDARTSRTPTTTSARDSAPDKGSARLPAALNETIDRA